MTVTVEEFYGDAVDVKVLDARHEGDSYARKILLALRGSGKVVQFGIVHIDLSVLAADVRAEIISRRTPLGRVLIEHNVLRTVQPTQFFRAIPGPAMANWFGAPAGTPTYGRLGVILTNGHPAIRVAEILAPIPADPSASNPA
jgi:chorismate-pyruvate lyase